MNEKISIPIILGTAREGNKSQRVARYLLKKIQEDSDIECVLVKAGEEKEYRTIAPWQLKDSQPYWHDTFARANAFIIVSPEYNHGYPGELKILLDSMYDEYAHKPFGICGVSSGSFGGVRVIEQLNQVVIALKGVPLPTNLFFSNVDDLFDEEDTVKDRAYEDRVDKFISELKWFSSTLKGAQNI